MMYTPQQYAMNSPLLLHTTKKQRHDEVIDEVLDEGEGSFKVP